MRYGDTGSTPLGEVLYKHRIGELTDEQAEKEIRQLLLDVLSEVEEEHAKTIKEFKEYAEVL